MISNYSPVAAFKLEDQKDVLTGYAAPGGESPCLLKLVGGDTPIFFARASGYSASAAADGFRSGWCGFEVHGAAQAFVVSDTVRLVCGVSGEVLAEITEPPRTTSASQPGAWSVTDLVSEVRRPDTSPSMDELSRFALNHYRRHGARQFIEATYETLLGRWPDANAPQVNERLADDEKKVATYLRMIVKSEEYQARWGGLMPGAFHPSFRYDRSGVI